MATIFMSFPQSMMLRGKVTGRQRSGNPSGTNWTLQEIGRLDCRISDSAEQGSQLFAVVAAGSQLGSVSEHHHVFAVKPRLQPLNEINVDDHGTVHAKKSRRVQSLLEFFERFTQDMLLSARVEPKVVARGLDPVDVRHPQKIDASFGADRNAIAKWALRSDRLQQ